SRESTSRESLPRDATTREPGGRRDNGRAESRRLSETRGAEPRIPEARPEREPWGSERLSRTGETLRDPYADRDGPRDRDDRDHTRERDAREPERKTARELARDRGSARQLSRTTPAPAGSVSYPTHDNLALAPQVQLRERAVVSEEKSRRYQITTLHPTSYAEARTIGEHFRDGYPVIMNLTEMDEPDAKRLVDFAAGRAVGTPRRKERGTDPA